MSTQGSSEGDGRGADEYGPDGRGDASVNSDAPDSDAPDSDGAVRRPRAHDEFKVQLDSTKADIKRQMKATKAQIDATTERIEARTGRNLIFAIAIGVLFGLVMLFSLIIVKELFVIVAGVVAGFSALELASALRGAGWNVPRIPTVITAVAAAPAAYYWDAHGLWLTLVAGVLFIMVWRTVEQFSAKRRSTVGALARDLRAGILIQAYVSLLASFGVLLVAQPNGQWWTVAFIILVAATDTGAYASGLAFGKHPMAPKISPKKTWEGFAGAAAASVIAGILLSVFMIHQPWWFGIIFGLVMLGTATLGDLAESLIKRDIGIKDMSSWLPGHGGFLDRLDSILPSAAAAFALYLIFQ